MAAICEDKSSMFNFTATMQTDLQTVGMVRVYTYAG